MTLRSSGFLTLILVLLVVGCSPDPPGPIPDFDSELMIDDLLNEPSGLTYHPTRSTVFAVGDEGDVFEMDVDGNVVQWKRIIFGADFEGITVDPATGLLYIVNEDDGLLLAVNPDSLEVEQEFTITGSHPALQNGIEALAYVNGDSGDIYIGFESRAAGDTSEIQMLSLPDPGNDDDDPAVTASGGFTVNTREISGLFYDEISQNLLAVNDSEDLLLVITLEGEILATYDLPGRDQEGVAITPDGYLLIADDWSGVYRYNTQRSQ